jgi:CheY-like chemotaxis protein
MGRAVPSNRPVVLVVEDDVLIRMNAMDMVLEAGFEAVAASDADEAIRILESRNDIRAVFTDVQMPGSMDGMRLAGTQRKATSANGKDGACLDERPTTSVGLRNALSYFYRGWRRALNLQFSTTSVEPSMKI